MGADVAAYWIWCIDQACLIAANDVELKRQKQSDETRTGKKHIQFVTGPRGWYSEDEE